MQAQYEAHVRAVGVLCAVTDHKQAIENLQREYRVLEERLHFSDHTLQTIAYEIHDGLAQYLAAAMMQFQAFGRLEDHNSDKAAKAFEAGLAMLHRSHAEARQLISRSRMPLVDDLGIESAILRLVHHQRSQSGPKIAFKRFGRFDGLSSFQENTLYRIAQEALANACRHSKSSKVRITLTQKSKEVQLKVRDWGTGFDTATVERGHFGLESIRQRTRLLNGTLVVRSSSNKGTCITVRLPIALRQMSGEASAAAGN